MCSHAEPFEGWTDKEKILFGTASLALIADYKSTASVLYPDQGYRELNPILGPHPSRAKLSAYFITYLIGNYFIADYLGHANRERWLLTLTIVETAAAAHNVSIGATIRF